ncbi:hypothetical protein OAT06_05425 [Nitrospinaceae bacterium]|nr:hypothetical protein [Nitrospinaceae bacterium]
MKNLLSNKKISGAIFGLAFGIILCLVLPIYFEWVKISGYEIPQDDLVGDYFVGFLWACVLGISILIWPVSKSDKTGLLWIWLAKVFITLGILLIYEWIYPDDQWSYFSIPAKLGYEPFGYFLEKGGDIAATAGTRRLDHIVWWHNHIFPSGSYHALKVSFSMVGLIAIYIFYRAGMLFMEKKGNPAFFYVLALTPTDLVWSSTLGKEPIVLFGIALYVYGVVAWQKKGQAFALIFSVAGILIAASIRFWLAPILVLPLAAFLIVGKVNFFTKLIFIGLTIYISATSLATIQSRYKLTSIQSHINQLSEISQNGSTGGSAQKIKPFNSIIDVLTFFPLGFFTALFRPLPGDLFSPFGLLASFEGLFFLWLFLRAFKRSSLRDIKNPLIFWGVLVILSWTSIYAFVAYQNLGTAMRWRLQILPLFLGLLLYLGRNRTKTMSTPITKHDITPSQTK